MSCTWSTNNSLPTHNRPTSEPTILPKRLPQFCGYSVNLKLKVKLNLFMKVSWKVVFDKWNVYCVALCCCFLFCRYCYCHCRDAVLDDSDDAVVDWLWGCWLVFLSRFSFLFLAFSPSTCYWSSPLCDCFAVNYKFPLQLFYRRRKNVLSTDRVPWEEKWLKSHWYSIEEKNQVSIGLADGCIHTAFVYDILKEWANIMHFVSDLSLI